MRTREQIKKYVGFLSADREILEVLLDIRELLITITKKKEEEA